MSIDITHTIRPQKVQFLRNKGISESGKNQAICPESGENSPQSSLFLWFFYHNKDI